MKRRYLMYAEVVVYLADPGVTDENAVRELQQRVAAYVQKECDDFPWPVDITLSTQVDRVET